MGNKYLSLLLTLALTSVLLTQAEGQVNSYDRPFTYTCPSGQFLSNIASRHDNGKEDRLFYLSCRTLPTDGTPVNCAWSGYTNGFDEVQVYQCPNEGYIAGMSSYHSNGAEDRRYKFYCCQLPDKYAHNCYYTGWRNGFDQYFSYSVPNGKILRGMISYHSNGAEDRRFQFHVCDLTKQYPRCIFPA